MQYIMHSLSRDLYRRYYNITGRVHFPSSVVLHFYDRRRNDNVPIYNNSNIIIPTCVRICLKKKIININK